MRMLYAHGNVARAGSVGYRLQELLRTRNGTPSIISKTQARQHSGRGWTSDYFLTHPAKSMIDGKMGTTSVPSGKFGVGTLGGFGPWHFQKIEAPTRSHRAREIPVAQGVAARGC